MSKIKDYSKTIKDFITGLITPEMEKSKIDEYNNILNVVDSINSEDESRDNELVECKEVIIQQLKSQGSSDEPKEEKEEVQPRSLEEIATSISNGGK